jgi:TolB-like protein/class 3 adenylate cyclase
MAEEGFKRKLAAILSADAEGYSRLMDDNEEATVRTLSMYRTAINDLVQQYRGRVVDTPGDNILAEFTSVVDSVNCAVEIQRELAERNAELPENRRMQFRIGVNLGDVIEEEGRIYGDGVNIAARVEAMAEAGGICVSGRAYDQVANKLGLEYENLGEHQVKNITTPIRIFRVLSLPGAAAHRVVQAKKAVGKKWRNLVVAAGSVVLIVAVAVGVWQFYMRPPSVEPASKEKMAFSLPEKPSIAVLPFDNMSGDTAQDYFSDGLTDQIISSLSKVADLFVIARNSTFTYKGKPVKVQQVAEELGVRYVLEGSVRKAEDRVRITAQLVNALTGHHLWSESYEGDLKDIFALQDEITMEVVTAMRVKLTEGDQARITAKGTKNLKAYLKHLEGTEQLFLLNKEANFRAKQLFEEAIALDPEYGAAYAFLGFCHLTDVLYGWSKSPPKSFQRAFELAQKALSHDDSQSRPYIAISDIYLLQRKYEKAIAEAQKAVEINPNGSRNNFNLGWILRCAGRPEEGIPLLKKAIRLNPIAQVTRFDVLGRAYFLTRYEEAIAAYKTVVKIDPDYRDSHVGLAATYAILGREEEARTEVAEILRIEPSFSIKNYEKFMFFQVGLEVEIEGLRKAGLPE